MNSIGITEAKRRRTWSYGCKHGGQGHKRCSGYRRLVYGELERCTRPCHNHPFIDWDLKGEEG